MSRTVIGPRAHIQDDADMRRKSRALVAFISVVSVLSLFLLMMLVMGAGGTREAPLDQVLRLRDNSRSVMVVTDDGRSVLTRFLKAGCSTTEDLDADCAKFDSSGGDSGRSSCQRGSIIHIQNVSACTCSSGDLAVVHVCQKSMVEDGDPVGSLSDGPDPVDKPW